MTDEDNIFDRFGKRNAFRVPDGYFDDLDKNVMRRCPEYEIKANTIKVSILTRLWRPVMYAACLIACVVSLWSAYMSIDTDAKTDLNDTSVAMTGEDNYLDEIADYAMMDDIDIYNCLASDN